MSLFLQLTSGSSASMTLSLISSVVKNCIKTSCKTYQHIAVSLHAKHFFFLNLYILVLTCTKQIKQQQMLTPHPSLTLDIILPLFSLLPQLFKFHFMFSMGGMCDMTSFFHWLDYWLLDLPRFFHFLLCPGTDRWTCVLIPRRQAFLALPVNDNVQNKSDWK